MWGLDAFGLWELPTNNPTMNKAKGMLGSPQQNFELEFVFNLKLNLKLCMCLLLSRLFSGIS